MTTCACWVCCKRCTPRRRAGWRPAVVGRLRPTAWSCQGPAPRQKSALMNRTNAIADRCSRPSSTSHPSHTSRFRTCRTACFARRAAATHRAARAEPTGDARVRGGGLQGPGCRERVGGGHHRRREPQPAEDRTRRQSRDAVRQLRRRELPHPRAGDRSREHTDDARRTDQRVAGVEPQLPRRGRVGVGGDGREVSRRRLRSHPGVRTGTLQRTGRRRRGRDVLAGLRGHVLGPDRREPRAEGHRLESVLVDNRRRGAAGLLVPQVDGGRRHRGSQLHASLWSPGWSAARDLPPTRSPPGQSP